MDRKQRQSDKIRGKSDLCVDNKNVFAYQVIEAAELVESKENEGLKGKLKSVAMTLNDESNPVVMILKNK